MNHLCLHCEEILKLLFEEESKVNLISNCKKLKHRPSPKEFCLSCKIKFHSSLETLDCNHQKNPYFKSEYNKEKNIVSFHSTCNTCHYNHLKNFEECSHPSENNTAKFKALSYSLSIVLNRNINDKGVNYPILLDEKFEIEKTPKLLMDKFWRDIINIQETMDSITKINKQIIMTEQDRNHFDKATQCEACGINFKYTQKVQDHDHLTAKYRYALCKTCNLKLRESRNNISIFLHNFSGFDSHILMTSLPSNLTVFITPMSSEKIIALTIQRDMETKNKNQCFTKFIFKDSASFLQASLEKSMKNVLNSEKSRQEKLKEELKKKCFHNTDKCEICYNKKILEKDSLLNLIKQSKICLSKEGLFSEELFMLTLAKGIFPYELLTSYDDIYKITKPPSESSFYSDLGIGVYISKEDYKTFLNSWQTLEKFKYPNMNLALYLEWYNRLDTVQLSVLMQNFKKNSRSITKLYADHFLTLPSLAYQSILHQFQQNNTKVEIVTDIKMYNFILEGLRGGISSVFNSRLEVSDFEKMEEGLTNLETFNKKLGFENPSFKMEYFSDETFKSIKKNLPNLKIDDFHKSKKYFSKKQFEEISQEKNNIFYLDLNNLYGSAQTLPLPQHSFEWISQTEIKTLNKIFENQHKHQCEQTPCNFCSWPKKWKETFWKTNNNNELDKIFYKNTGFILSINLSYDEETRNFLKEYPPFASHLDIKEEMLSNFNKTMLKISNSKFQVNILLLSCHFLTPLSYSSPSHNIYHIYYFRKGRNSAPIYSTMKNK